MQIIDNPEDVDDPALTPATSSSSSVMLESTEEENNELWEYFNKKKEECLHKGNEINLLEKLKDKIWIRSREITVHLNGGLLKANNFQV
jgi:hypothetical protein